jgi:hypothetical protein
VSNVHTSSLVHAHCVQVCSVRVRVIGISSRVGAWMGTPRHLLAEAECIRIPAGRTLARPGDEIASIYFPDAVSSRRERNGNRSSSGRGSCGARMPSRDGRGSQRPELWSATRGGGGIAAEKYGRALRFSRFEVVTVSNGDAALRKIAADPADVVDLRLRPVALVELVRQVRARQHGRHTPVAILTADYYSFQMTLEEEHLVLIT